MPIAPPRCDVHLCCTGRANAHPRLHPPVKTCSNPERARSQSHSRYLCRCRLALRIQGKTNLPTEDLERTRTTCESLCCSPQRHRAGLRHCYRPRRNRCMGACPVACVGGGGLEFEKRTVLAKSDTQKHLADFRKADTSIHFFSDPCRTQARRRSIATHTTAVLRPTTIPPIPATTEHPEAHRTPQHCTRSRDPHACRSRRALDESV